MSADVDECFDVLMRRFISVGVKRLCDTSVCVCVCVCVRCKVDKKCHRQHQLPSQNSSEGIQGSAGTRQVLIQLKSHRVHAPGSVWHVDGDDL